MDIWYNNPWVVTIIGGVVTNVLTHILDCTIIKKISFPMAEMNKY